LPGTGWLTGWVTEDQNTGRNAGSPLDGSGPVKNVGASELLDSRLSDICQPTDSGEEPRRKQNFRRKKSRNSEEPEAQH
jgi:hypothetical protein